MLVLFFIGNVCFFLFFIACYVENAVVLTPPPPPLLEPRRGPTRFKMEPESEPPALFPSPASPPFTHTSTVYPPPLYPIYMSYESNCNLANFNCGELKLRGNQNRLIVAKSGQALKSTTGYKFCGTFTTSIFNASTYVYNVHNFKYYSNIKQNFRYKKIYKFKFS